MLEHQCAAGRVLAHCEHTARTGWSQRDLWSLVRSTRALARVARPRAPPECGGGRSFLEKTKTQWPVGPRMCKHRLSEQPAQPESEQADLNPVRATTPSCSSVRAGALGASYVWVRLRRRPTHTRGGNVVTTDRRKPGRTLRVVAREGSAPLVRRAPKPTRGRPQGATPVGGVGRHGAAWGLRIAGPQNRPAARALGPSDPMAHSMNLPDHFSLVARQPPHHTLYICRA